MCLDSLILIKLVYGSYGPDEYQVIESTYQWIKITTFRGCDE